MQKKSLSKRSVGNHAGKTSVPRMKNVPVPSHLTMARNGLSTFLVNQVICIVISDLVDGQLIDHFTSSKP